MLKFLTVLLVLILAAPALAARSAVITCDGTAITCTSISGSNNSFYCFRLEFANNNAVPTLVNSLSSEGWQSSWNETLGGTYCFFAWGNDYCGDSVTPSQPLCTMSNSNYTLIIDSDWDRPDPGTSIFGCYPSQWFIDHGYMTTNCNTGKASAPAPEWGAIKQLYR